MKKLFAILSAICLQSTLVCCQTSQKDFPIFKGPYLGQNPPGNFPELFGPGIVSRDDHFEHSAAVFSPDGKEVYWSSKPNGARYFEINSMKMINGRWTGPKIAFSCEGYNFHNPVFSPDGDKLYFTMESDIWFVERRGKDWSEPAKISPIINSAFSDYLHTITENGSVYLRRYKPNEKFGKRSIFYISRKINGIYSEPEIICENINSADAEEMAVFVAPDESYMIIEAHEDNSTGRLFISYKLKDGTWSERIILPFRNGRFPSVTPDGKYLFYMTRDDGIYWVNTSFIEELKPKE